MARSSKSEKVPKQMQGKLSATEALKQLRSELINRGASLEEMLAELRRMREAGGD